jgi:ubiquitin-protein ligase
VALPTDILRKRLRNEIRLVREELHITVDVEDPEFTSFPVIISITLENVPALVLNGTKLAYQKTHRIKIEVPREYPYQKPAARFLSDIFHPNIVPPERGGWVCTKLLDCWDFSSNLVTFLSGLQILISNPNPESPYKDETSILAARYFLEHPVKPSPDP